MYSKPPSKIKIPQAWNGAQALCVIDFLHRVADTIWDFYERPILDLMDRKGQNKYDKTGSTQPTTSQNSSNIPEKDIPF